MLLADRPGIGGSKYVYNVSVSSMGKYSLHRSSHLATMHIVDLGGCCNEITTCKTFAYPTATSLYRHTKNVEANVFHSFSHRKCVFSNMSSLLKQGAKPCHCVTRQFCSFTLCFCASFFAYMSRCLRWLNVICSTCWTRQLFVGSTKCIP